MELNGTWWATPAEGGTLRGSPDADSANRDWVAVPVPGHWARVPELGSPPPEKVLYRHQFNQEPPEPNQRRWLVFNGLLYQADVWLNGTYLGDAEGYFSAHQFEVTEAMAGFTEHTLTMELSCPPRSPLTSPANLMGTLGQTSEMLPDGNSGGLWAPVQVVSTGEIRITDLRVSCSGASNRRAVTTFQADLDASQAELTRLHTSIGEIDHVSEHVLAAGHNQVEWRVVIPNPQRWWPHQLGDQPQYEISVEARSADGQLSDFRQTRTGLRTVQMDDWKFSINGVRLFLKGTSFGPTTPWLAETDQDQVRRDVDMAKSAGLNLIRVFGHLATPALYDAADEAGMMIWQDLPLVGPFPRGNRSTAVDCARAAVGAVGAHPSVILWCGHVDPLGDAAHSPGADHSNVGRKLTNHQKPSWNLSVLDRSIKRELERRDSTRPVVAYSGVLPHLPRLDGTDTHLWLGWHHGKERDLERFAKRWPRVVRFVSQFGAQSPPQNLDWIEDDLSAWPNLDWNRLAQAHGLDLTAMNRHVPPVDYATAADWQAAAWSYQAMLIRRYIETLRRLKYQPVGGFCQHFFADTHPAVSTALVDWQRQPKPALDALAKACQPVIVVADRLDTELAPGDELALNIHVVNDHHNPLTELRTDATLEWPDGSHTWSWVGSVGADECVRVGTVNWTVPHSPAGPATLHLQLSGPTQATNRYDSTIT